MQYLSVAHKADLYLTGHLLVFRQDAKTYIPYRQRCRMIELTGEHISFLCRNLIIFRSVDGCHILSFQG